MCHRQRLSYGPAVVTLVVCSLLLFCGPAVADEPAHGWTRSTNNPVLSLGKPGEFDAQNIFAPAAVKDGGRYYLFYSGGPSGPANGGEFVRYQLGLAISDDGATFRKRGQPLLPLGERDNFHCTPALLRNPEGSLHKAGGLWHLVYCGNRADDVEYATSPNGLDWQKHPRSPIYRKAYSPTLVQLPGQVRMYYIHKPAAAQGGRREPWEVHLAAGPDLFSLQPHPDNPVLRVSQPWETDALFYPYVLREGETWILFYAAYWNKSADRDRFTAIGLATSSDGIEWTKHPDNPVLTPTPGSDFDSRYTSSQSILRDGDHYKLFYGSRIDMRHKYYAIGLATHPAPLLPASGR